jgi:hypothetical protein
MSGILIVVMSGHLLFSCDNVAGCSNTEPDSSCDYWAGTGECQLNPTFMNQHCVWGCRTCEQYPPGTEKCLYCYYQYGVMQYSQWYWKMFTVLLAWCTADKLLSIMGAFILHHGLVLYNLTCNTLRSPFTGCNNCQSIEFYQLHVTRA